MLPKGAEVQTIGSLLYWRNQTLMVSGAAAQQIGDEVLRLASKPY